MFGLFNVNIPYRGGGTSPPNPLSEREGECWKQFAEVLTLNFEH